ncbi:putative sulfate exporter family transporter [Hellea sp.]|nr:putative sulfate exporter family transporter [Hellea sp.]MDA8889033.1 putative sulfate exporter family transporter [Hellea sp.]MDA9048163.1 putative sulfate exporter family transporter [Hellea sp.]MDC0651573.1 putative sulfate exporter family transporter [Hellea sp.]MDC1061927.1 putative sulfate exporter family transporter [Hellea sp.]MDC1089588.1 putative sulfate exporter family transporter [Hellea sp.]
MQISLSKYKGYTPGLLVSILAGILAAYISEITVIPVMLLAIIIGLLLHVLNSVSILKDGINWSSRGLLYTGVALMGLRIDLTDLSQVGFMAPLFVILTLITTLLVGYAIARALGQSKDFSILMSGAVGICGVSAAAAICSALEDNPLRDAQLAITVAGITVLSTLAMLLYPFISNALNLNILESGIFMGGGIHNVSQAVGAGYAVSNEAGDLAVIFKLIRVSMLLPVIIIISLVWRKGSSTPYPNVRSKLKASTPPFLVVFCLLALLSCLNIVPDLAKNAGNISAHWALIISLVAIGIKTDTRLVMKVGAMPLTIMTLTTAFMGAMLLIGISLIV